MSTSATEQGLAQKFYSGNKRTSAVRIYGVQLVLKLKHYIYYNQGILSTVEVLIIEWEVKTMNKYKQVKQQHR